MIRALHLCAVLLLFGGQAAAQDVLVPSKLSLAQAWRLAEDRNPSLAAAREAVTRAEAGITTAGTRPNPSLNVASEGYAFSRGSGAPWLNQQEIAVRAEQEIELGDRRALRIGVAQSGVDAARAELADRRRQLLFEVRRAYLSAVLAQAELDVATTTLGGIDTLVTVNRARLEQGEISGVEMRRLQVERFRFADDRFAAELSVRNTRGALLALLAATPLDQPFELTDGLTAAPAAAAAGPAVDLRALALASRPDVQAARRGLEAAGRDVTLQHVLRVPNITIGAGYRRDFGSGGAVLDFTVPLPFFDRNQGGIARAGAERLLAGTRVRAAELTAALEVQQAMNAVEINRNRVSYVEREYLRNAREARDIVLASYRAGASTLTDYLDAQRALREAQRVQNRALYEYQLSLFLLDSATGRMPSDASAAPRKEMP